MAPVTHIVAFKFNDGVSSSDQKDTYDRFLSLKETCKRDDRSYITSLRGGHQSSPEGHHKDMQLVFVVEFGSIEDRDYYLEKDPVHAEFAELARSRTSGAVILDFSEGF